jgi:hypothetical protein
VLDAFVISKQPRVISGTHPQMTRIGITIILYDFGLLL